MDSRLFTIYGKRPYPLTTKDLPELARGIVGFFRNTCSVERGDAMGVLYVRLHAKALNVVVRADDWAKIVPYLQDGSLDPQVIPVEPIVTADPSQYDLSTIDVRDHELYVRVLNLLNSLFTTTFPKPQI